MSVSGASVQAALERMISEKYEPIAIVGTGIRLSGGISGMEEFHRLLIEGRDNIVPIPASRWDNRKYFKSLRDTENVVCTNEGGYLEDIDKFDPAFFSISPKEARYMDPQQRIMLELCWHALENAGLNPSELRGGGGAVYLGSSSLDYAREMVGLAQSQLVSQLGTGTANSAISGRISYFLGWRGPCMTLDTACSSSLVAIHLAAAALRNRETSLALAGGINIVHDPISHIIFTRANMLAPDGRCKTFDESADGYGRSEGAVVLVLKRLSDALADGNRILALIRGTAVGQDGESGGLTVPNGRSQEVVMREALKRSPLSPDDISYVEAHGTGTPLGDPIEMHAINALFKGCDRTEHKVHVGSSKTNLGHMEAVAGAGGVLKCIAQLTHGVIYPHIHMHSPSSKIDWPSLTVAVPTEAVAWDVPVRRALVNSFGFAGTIACIVLEQAPVDQSPHATIDASSSYVEDTPLVATISAKSPSALVRNLEAHLKFVRTGTRPIADYVWTSSVGRAHHDCRWAAPARDRDRLIQAMSSALADPEAIMEDFERNQAFADADIAFLITGQGAQAAGMGAGLHRSSPEFRNAFDEAACLFDSLMGVSMREVMFREDPESAARLSRTEYTQPALFIFSYAAARMWMAYGVRPAILLGHSVGEIVAACLAGLFSLQDAARMTVRRAQLMQAVTADGAMLAVMASADTLRTLIAPYEDIGFGGFNGPKQTVLSGGTASIKRVSDALTAGGIAHRRLDVSHAFHSVHMTQAASEFLEFMKTVNFLPMQRKFVSNVTGSIADHALVASPEYWARHITAPVDFNGGISSIAAAGTHLFLEIGPSPHLTALGRSCVEASEHRWIATVDRKKSENESLQQAIVELYMAGQQLDWRALHGASRGRLCEIPEYAFDRGAYWMPAAAGKNAAAGAAHPLLGELSSTGDGDWHYTARISAHSPAYLGDHVVAGHTIFPGTAYVETVLAVQDAIFGCIGMAMQDLEILEPLLLPEDGTVEISTHVSRAQDGSHRVEIVSNEDGRSRLHFRCRLPENDAPIAEIDFGLEAESTASSDFDKTALYARLASLGLQYGKQFQRVESLRRIDARHVVGTLSCDDIHQWEILNPGLFDGILHTLEPLLGQDRTMIPVGWSKIRLWRKPRGRVHCSARLQADCDPLDSEIRVDLVMHANGRPILHASGLRLRELKSKARPIRNDLHRLVWRESALDPREIAVNTLFVVGCPESMRPHFPNQSDFVEDFGQALEATVRLHGQRPDDRVQIVWFWNAPRVASQTDTDLIDQACRVVYEPLLDFVKALHLRAPAQRVELVCVTCGAFSAGVRNNQQPDRSGITIDHQLQATLSGFCAVLNSEFSRIRAKVVDLADNEAPSAKAHSILNELYLAGARADNIVAYRDNKRLVRRLVVAKMPDQTSNFRLSTSDDGLLSSLRLETIERIPPTGDQIEVRVEAAGLNFKDVINALGLLQKNAEDLNLPYSKLPLGFECAGVVVAAGELASFEVGERVMVSHLGCMQRHLTVSSRAAARIPQGLGFEQAAAIPTAFITSYHALYNLAKVGPEDRVLIHAAAGGVGQAALQLCKRRGAEVFATASAGKWHILREQGIRHVMDSRSTAFVDDIRRSTDGRGVTVVLNSLNKDFIAAGLEATAENGRFVEIGKLGVWSPEQVAAIRPDIDYLQFDLSELPESRLLDVNETILDDIARMLEAGEIEPPPITCYPMDRCAEAFGLLARGANVGKIVLRLGEVDDPDLGLSRVIRTDGTYLVTGGYGALGQEAADWLARSGARHVALLGRRLPERAAIEKIEQRLSGLESIDFLVGDVADAAAIERMFADAESKKRPICGVIHLAGVIADAPIMELDWESCRSVFRPKIAGTWNLWRTAESRGGVDLFLCYSSIASVIGSVSQANYAAANAFIDGLMTRECDGRAIGLALNWGPWADVGMAAELTDQQRKAINRKGISLISLQQGMSAFGRLLEHAQGQFVVGEVDWTEYKSSLPAEDALYEEVEEANLDRQQENAFDVERLSALTMDERTAEVQHEVIRILRQVLQSGEGDRIPRRATFAELGVDSLVAVELRNMLEKSFRLALPSSLVFDYPAIPSLVLHLSERIGQSQPRQHREHENLQAAEVAVKTYASATEMELK